MSRTPSHLDEAFVREQQRRLERLREEVRANQAAAGREELQLQREWDEPRDIADRGTDVSQQDIDDSVQRSDAVRLDEVDRALEKIDAGHYGLSDASGEPIPRERLEAKPEAIFTVEEEAQREGEPGDSARNR